MGVLSKEDLEKDGTPIWSMEEKKEYKQTNKTLISKILKSKWKVYPRVLLGPAGEDACMLFHIWNTESDKSCLLRQQKLDFNFICWKFKFVIFTFITFYFSTCSTLLLLLFQYRVKDVRIKVFAGPLNYLKKILISTQTCFWWWVNLMVRVYKVGRHYLKK